MAVLHHHRLVPRQSEGDAVLPAAVDGLQQQQQRKAILTHSGTFSMTLAAHVCCYIPVSALK